MNGKYRLVFWFVVDLGKCLAYVNAANDFIVFYLVSNNYRWVFKEMYCCRYVEETPSQRSRVVTETQSGSNGNVPSATLSSAIKERN